MKILEKIKELIKGSSRKEYILKDQKSSEISIIDTSTLEINENLNDIEKNEYDEFLKEIKRGDISTLITYGNDIAKTINHYMEITRKRINQNIEENNSLSRISSTEEIISRKLKIIFNNAEIDNILGELESLSRECEIRVLALRRSGEEELKKSGRRISIFSNKCDYTKLDSINNAISRLSSSIQIISMLVKSIKIEQYNSKIENDTIDKFLENNNPQENMALANKVLNNTFEELRSSLNTIIEMNGNQDYSLDIENIDFEKEEIKSKIEIIAGAKKTLDLYVTKNKKDFFKEDGIFPKVNSTLDRIISEIESDYFDLDLWAKKLYETNTQEKDGKYYEELQNIEKIISIFDEEIPEEFKEKYYRTKFYYKALCLETRDNDDIDIINTDISEKEKSYYIKFFTEIIEKMHTESKDGELLKFMDKYLSIKDVDNILTDYKRFVALLRIEKYGRDGLFTMILYDHKDQRTDENYHKDFTYRALDMEDGRKLNSIEKDKMYLLKDSFTLKQLYGTSEPFCLDILRLWKDTNQANRFNCLFGDHNNIENNEWWENKDRITFKKEFTTPRDILRQGLQVARKDKNLRYLSEVSKRVNKKIRISSKKQDGLWNSKYIFKGKMSCSLAEFLAGFALGFEKIYRGNAKEQVMNKILQFNSIRSDENGNVLISQFGEEPRSIKSGEVLDLATILALHTSLEYYSDYYRDILKENKEGKFQIFDKKIKIFFENLGSRILSKFLTRENINDDVALDIEYINFFEDTKRMIRNRIKQDIKKPKEEQSWNTEILNLSSSKISIAELITTISNNVEENTSGKISREMARNSILSYYSIKQEGNLVIIKRLGEENRKTFTLEDDDLSDLKGINEIMTYLESNIHSIESSQEHYR